MTVSLAANSDVVGKIAGDFKKNGYTEYSAVNVEILPNGRAIFSDVFEKISKSQRSVYVEFYKIWNDSIGNAFLDVLAERAKSGIDVRVIYDSFGNSGKKAGFTNEYVQKYRDLGIKIEGFDPMRFPYINHALHRDHRKMVIVDDSIVYTGGLNVADYYITGKPDFGVWRDMFIRMEGSVVGAYRQLFMEMWNRCPGQDEHINDINNIKNSSDSLESVFVASREPGKLSNAMRLAYRIAIDGASKQIVIVNPYPIHCKTVRKALYRALERGVAVKYMVSYISDHSFMTSMVGVEMRKLQQRGAEVYLYKGGFHHDKIILVDDTVCSVGTANMDARSMCFDWEVSPFLFSPSTTKKLQNCFDADVEDSYYLTDDNYKQLYNRKQRFVGKIMRIFKGIL